MDERSRGLGVVRTVLLLCIVVRLSISRRAVRRLWSTREKDDQLTFVDVLCCFVHVSSA